MKFNPDIIKSDRKTLSIEVRPDGKVTVRAPQRMSYRDIDSYVEKNADRIQRMIDRQNARTPDALPKYTREELERATAEAKLKIPPRVAYYAALLGVTYNEIKIKTPKTRWGSCSSKGNLNFNALLMFMPPEITDSVIVHELCHRKEMNHSKRFYAEILRVMPDYREREKWLKENGIRYMSRL